jgi:hypothetical protein
LDDAAVWGEKPEEWAALKRFRDRIPNRYWDELDFSSPEESLDAFCSGGGIRWWVRTWLLWQETPKKGKFQRSVKLINALTGVPAQISTEQKLMYTRTFEDGSTREYDMGKCILNWKVQADTEDKEGSKDTPTMKRLVQVRKTLITELNLFVDELKNKTDGQGEIKDRKEKIQAIEEFINSIPEPYYETKDGKKKLPPEDRYKLYISDDDKEGSIGWWVRVKLPDILNDKIGKFRGIPSGEHAVTYTDASKNAYNMSADINTSWRNAEKRGDATARDRMHGVRVTLLRKLKTYLENLKAASPRNEDRIRAIEKFIKNVEDNILAESTPA